MSKFYAVEITGAAPHENIDFVNTKGEGVKCCNVDMSIVNDVVIFDADDASSGSHDKLKSICSSAVSE
jgi:hypothetical protein